MILGIGVDVVDISRLDAALRRTPALASRLFTEGERDGAPASLAACFAAKEAVAKALDLRSWNFRDVEVLGTGGPPELRLHGAAAARAAELGVHVEVSLTHTGRDAAAVAVAAAADG